MSIIDEIQCQAEQMEQPTSRLNQSIIQAHTKNQRRHNQIDGKLLNRDTTDKKTWGIICKVS